MLNETYDAVAALEEGCEDEYEAAVAMQKLINNGMAWRLQGSYGRMVMDAMGAGLVMLGREGCRDYWGNYVPSRFEVISETKGGYQYVANIMGEEYAKNISEVL